MSIDLGNNPVGSPPTEAEKLQIRTSLGVNSVVSTFNIPSGVSSITVTGENLLFTPTGISSLTIQKPLGSDPDLLIGNYYNLSSDGVSVNLSSPTEKAGYILSITYV